MLQTWPSIGNVRLAPECTDSRLSLLLCHALGRKPHPSRRNKNAADLCKTTTMVMACGRCGDVVVHPVQSCFSVKCTSRTLVPPLPMTTHAIGTCVKSLGEKYVFKTYTACDQLQRGHCKCVKVTFAQGELLTKSAERFPMSIIAWS